MMTTYFTYPTTSQYDDIRGSRKTCGVSVITDLGTAVIVADDPIDHLTVQLPELTTGGELVISSLVRIWTLVFVSSSPVLTPTSNLEVDFGMSIQLNFSKEENCWILVRSF